MTKVLLCENPTRMRPFFTFRRTYRKLTRTLRSTNYSRLKAKLTKRGKMSMDVTPKTEPFAKIAA